MYVCIYIYEMLKENVREKPKQILNIFSLTLTYNRFYSIISKVIRKIGTY